MTIHLDQSSIREQPEALARLLRAVHADAAFLRGSYPEFDRWFASKVIPGILKGERTVILEERDGHPAALLILKHGAGENKLCTLRVRPEYERRGLGVRMFEKAFAVLQTSEPLLSVSELSMPRFERIFRHFGFACERTYLGIYVPRVRELAFNGILLPESARGDRGTGASDGAHQVPRAGGERVAPGGGVLGARQTCCGEEPTMARKPLDKWA